MDENSQSAEEKSSGMKLLVPAVVIGLIVIAVVAFYVMGQNTNSTAGTPSPTPVATAPTSAPTEAMITSTEGAQTSSYKDGEYSADGNYVSPGGPRVVGVTLTLEDGVVTEAEFEGRATDATSKRFQGEFANGFKSQVVGKNIDEIQVVKVAGSSLSPKGFMDAVEKIKAEAQS